MLIVDDAITEMQMVPDIFMNKAVPSELPYNKKSRSVQANKKADAKSTPS